MGHYNGAKPTTSSAKAKGSPPAYTPQTRPAPWYDKLYDEQKRAVEFILSRPATALFCVPGVGKTFVSMAVLEALRPRCVLIVAPLTSLGVTWYPKLITLPDVLVLGGLQELAGSLKNDPRSDTRRIVLTNPDALRRSLKQISKFPWDFILWDESQNIKNRSSLNSRLARRLRHVPRRIALSGTPIDTGQIDIWAQMRFVNHAVLGENWQDFANEYCYKSGWMGKEWVFSERKNAQFLDALKEHIFRLDDGFLGLKPLAIVPVPVPLLGRQAQIYDDMKRDNLVTIEGVDITAHNVGARDVKLAQITGGVVLDREGGTHWTGNAKLRKLAHLLRKLGPPVVIFCQFLHEIDIVCACTEEWSTAVIQGSVSEEDRTQIIADFQAGHYQCLICQIRTGSESIDLTRASTLIMYSMTYSYINFEQVIRRLQRGGQMEEVTAYILYCINTVDEDKLRLVKQKSETSFRVLATFEE